ncbi:hypothetical protein KC360_g822 [Hortaea werneckii]|nr:hypothetical protein KC325_g1162 [Hortaea werneckii]KAI6999756.1 hypothetical protein KC359_g1552 [Hortaea werneckii]KAI7149778.1 hypothetical protein KC344_g715 [Hortaea werneckii]KAI7179457.1 hypothetical protein KC360_g822 [Hortaea werneckii]
MAEAAAGVVGLAQFGFSMATTLITYVGDFRDASDDITGLANEITATYRQVGELKSLLDKNKTSQSLSDSVRLEAEDCQLKAEKLATRLWKQLGKSDADIPKGRLIGSEDIEVSVFSRARWPIYKPRLDQHKQELMVLKQNIMMVFAMARMNNESDAIDRLRTQEQIDKLKKGKQLALEALRDATRRRKQARGRNRHQKRQRFVDTASRSRRSFAATDPDSTSYAYSVQTDFEAPERGPSYDSYGTVDEDGFDEAMSKAAELVHAGVLAQIKEEEEALRLDAATRQQRDAQIVAEYKAKLLVDLEKSHRDLDEMKRKLREAFGSAVNEEQIERYVAARKEEALRGEEVAKLLEELTDARTADTESASHQAEVGTLRRSSRSRFKFTNLFHRHGPRHTQNTLQFSSRRNSVTSDNTSSNTSSATSKASSIEIQGTSFHCVVVSIDAHNRTISRIRLPTAWLIVLLSRQKALQGTKRWYREAKHFKRTLATYAQLDFTSRRQAEAPQADESFQPQDLELLYARKLDEKRSKTRRMLDSTLLVAEPWDFYHGRVLLVYKINESSGNGHSDMRVSPNGPHRPPPYVNGPHNYHGPLNGGYNTRYVVKERVKTSFEGDRSQPWKPGEIGRRPVYPSTHRDFLSLETLAYYDIPYEIERSDPNYIIILREMDKYETEVLFEHTRRLRGGSARRRTSYEGMRDHNLRSESRDCGLPVGVDTYAQGTSSGYNEAGARTRDRSSRYQQSFSIPYQPGTSGLYSSTSPSEKVSIVYADYEYDGLHAHRSMSKRRSRSPSAYTDGRRSRPYSQRSYGANDGDTEVEFAFPDKQLIVRERDPMERWNSRQFSRDEGHELPFTNEMYNDKDRRSRDVEAKVEEEKEIDERRQKAQVEADVLRTIKDFKERESSFKGDTEVTAKRLAALALRSRSRSRSRSKAPSISSASVAERRSLQSPTKSTRMPMRSAQSYTRTARSQPQTFEHHSIDTVVQRRKWQDSENSPYKYGTELAGRRDNSRSRRGVRSSTLDTLPGRSILKTGENNRLGEEVSEDSISDVFADSEDSEDSSTESSESDEESNRQHGPATSAGTSELGLDRTMTDSPVSISSKDSHYDEHQDAGQLPASRNVPGSLRRMTGSISSSSARGPVFGANGEHFDNRAGTLDAVAPSAGSEDNEHEFQP